MRLNRKIIDTHFHIWDSHRFSLPWLSLFEGKLRLKYTLDDYLNAISELNIIKSCYEEIDTIKQQQAQEAEMIIGLCNDSSNQIQGATIAADLASTDFNAYIEDIAKQKAVKSVRHNLFAQDAKISQEKTFIENTKLLAEYDIMCDLVMPVAKMHYGIELVKSCPETQFVINHCGVCPIQANDVVMAAWQQGILDYARHENTLCKISECGFTKPDYAWQIADVTPIIHHCITSFGEDRIIYGTNWPVCEITAPISRWLEAINTCLQDFPEHVADKLFYENAKKYYRL